MLSLVWFTFLYQPLFNALIWLYGNVASHNLGWAVVWLTVFLRLILLPLTIISEYNSIRQEKAVAEAERAIVAFKGDRVAQQEEARKVMRKYKISPWAKVLMLLIQLLVLILLYQVFIRGISGEKILKILYPGIDYPGKINTTFYGFDIGFRHNSLWAGIVASYLFISIYLENFKRTILDKSDAFYWVAFPLFTFLALWYLPAVKSLFILTTMIFSDIIRLLRRLLLSSKKKPEEARH